MKLYILSRGTIIMHCNNRCYMYSFGRKNARKSVHQDIYFNKLLSDNQSGMTAEERNINYQNNYVYNSEKAMSDQL